MNVKFTKMRFDRSWSEYNFIAEVETDSVIPISDYDDYIYVSFTDAEIENELLVKFRINKAMKATRKRLNLRYNDLSKYIGMVKELAINEITLYDDDGKEITTETDLMNYYNKKNGIEPEQPKQVVEPAQETKKNKKKWW